VRFTPQQSGLSVWLRETCAVSVLRSIGWLTDSSLLISNRQAFIAEEQLAKLQTVWPSSAFMRAPWCLQSINPSVVAPKDSRAALFARFLVDTYGIEYLQSGSGEHGYLSL
jgi:hypothetical protein